MPVPMTPTLGANFLLTDPSEIISYQVRHFAECPKSASNLFYDYTESLADLISRYGDDAEDMITPVTRSLTNVLNRVFNSTPGTASVLVTVSTAFVEYPNYTLRIAVQVAMNGFAYSYSPKISVENGVIKLLNDNVTPVVTPLNS